MENCDVVAASGPVVQVASSGGRSPQPEPSASGAEAPLCVELQDRRAASRWSRSARWNEKPQRTFRFLDLGRLGRFCASEELPSVVSLGPFPLKPFPLRPITLKPVTRAALGSSEASRSRGGCAAAEQSLPLLPPANTIIGTVPLAAPTKHGTRLA